MILTKAPYCRRNRILSALYFFKLRLCLSPFKRIIPLVTLLFENTTLYILHYILQTFCASLSPPSYVTEVQSITENDWIVELSMFSSLYRYKTTFCSFFSGTNFMAPQNLTQLRPFLYIRCFFLIFYRFLFQVFLYPEFK